jgi:hypothetical protein
MKALGLGLLLLATVTVSCSTAAPDAASPAGASAPSEPAAPSFSPTPRPTSTSDPWEPGPAQDLQALQISAAVNGTAGDARDWSRWLNCRSATQTGSFLLCEIDLEGGRVHAAIFDWFDILGDDEEVDMAAVIMGATAGRGLALSGFCGDEADLTIAIASLGPGYDFVVPDPALTAEQRFDAATQVSDGVRRAMAASGSDQADKLADVDVINCADVED